MFARIGRTAALALGSIALGFIFIFFGWFGAAGYNDPQGQIPYLISGGAAGLAFIGVGVGLLIFESGRRATARLEAKLDELMSREPGSTSAAAQATPLPEAVATNGLVVVGRS